MPNAVNDSFPLNDTINITVCTPLNGIYTVNPALPASDTNFVSVQSFMSTAQLCGLSGPITLNVAPGIYNGALAFTSAIAGLSATNNIKIVGGILHQLQGLFMMVSWPKSYHLYEWCKTLHIQKS